MRIYWVILLLCLSFPSFALQWKGTIIDADSKQPIQGALITNMMSKATVQTDERGQFNIEGNANDKVTFTCPGYRTETHIIIPGIEGIRLSFSMRLSSRMLDEVIITQKYKTKYQIDSAERRTEQSRVLARQKSSIGSPVSFLAERLSKRQRAIFRFQKDFVKMEKEQFTDSRYTPEMVNTLTNLSGDTLAYFMKRYPIEYDYARTATALELKMWIRYNYKEFLKATDSLKVLNLPY